MRQHKRTLVGAFLATWLAAHPTGAQQGATGGEWRSYAADAWGTKYSPLDQIDGDNFGDLELAWRWRTADSHLPVENEHGVSLVAAETVFEHLEAGNPDFWVTRPGIARLSATPLMVDGVLYLATPLYQAAAIDARTGETLWVHNPRVYESGSPPLPSPWNHRGVAYWEDGDTARIIWGTGDGYLTAVDARTGLLAADFGDNGRISLEEGIPRARDNPSRLPPPSRSPPLVVGDTIIVGSSVHDYLLRRENAPGFARAYDARTGRHKWDFHTVPQSADEFGSETWLNEAWRYSGNTNVWGNIAADPELGYVYLPTSTPTSDYYGGHRIGDNLFAESLICVDLETGQRVWHFQMVHHGVWDYDNPTGPNLLDVTVDGRRVKALAQVTKQGFVYTFDRVTGEPIWPIEERSVATDTDLEGEVLSPTQPFPTRPAPFEYQGASIDALIDFTPEVRQMALEAVEGFRLGPLYTPLSLNGTIFRPSAGGGASWGGGAVDPETGVIYIPSRNAQSVMRFREPEPGEDSNLRYVLSRGGAAFLEGGNPRRTPVMPQGLPLWKPPYSRMTAIDMNTGEHLWMTPLGNGDRVRNHPLLRDLDLPPLGGDSGRNGPLVTKTLLLYTLTAGGAGDGPQLVAYDKATGEALAAVDLPGGAIGTPMTYKLDGRQYIALTVGGEAPSLVAFRLPR
ncbi:MAG: PQQ-binding-like beta-propeller repeat protein [Acidobacteria bacterium]|nr:PQQ-binding-like beta-propeller repeat protein [Acidobacteriota bacterium]MYH29664.1 PQQ-binding-like beta-propeller repeat protein [Acidobacteriota bacterium]